MSYSENTKQIWRNLKLFLSIKILFKIDVSFKNAGRFIDLETFIKDENDSDFVKMTIKRRLPFIKIPDIVKHYAIALYMIESEEVRQNFPWIYNPPQFPSNGEITQGSIERENFAKDYGSYMEMVYLCSGQNALKFNEVFEMDTKEFLFKSEYLIRKRTVENLK